jgi:hypothetical protein
MKTPIAYEWHNPKTGHCYVDYIQRTDLESDGEYTKTPLYKDEKEDIFHISKGYTEIVKIAESGILQDRDRTIKWMNRYVAKYPESDLYRPFTALIKGENGGLKLEQEEIEKKCEYSRDELIGLIKIARKGSIITSDISGRTDWRFDVDSESKVFDYWKSNK